MSWPRFLWYVMPLFWRHYRGRLYVFRDAPDWLVCKIAAIYPVSADSTNDVRTFVAAAVAERDLRYARRFPELHAITQALQKLVDLARRSGA